MSTSFARRTHRQRILSIVHVSRIFNLPSFLQLEQWFITTGPCSNLDFWIMVTPVVRLDVTAGDFIHNITSNGICFFSIWEYVLICQLYS